MRRIITLSLFPVMLVVIWVAYVFDAVEKLSALALSGLARVLDWYETRFWE